MKRVTEDGKPNQVLFSVAQTAAILGVGRTKAFALIGSGALGSVTIGSRRLVAATQIDAYVQRLIGPVKQQPDTSDVVDDDHESR